MSAPEAIDEKVSEINDSFVKELRGFIKKIRCLGRR
jgi:hypothetical protein